MTSMSVDTIKANNERLKRYQALETHAARLIGGWLPGVARWEVKKQLGYHLPDPQFLAKKYHSVN